MFNIKKPNVMIFFKKKEQPKFGLQIQSTVKPDIEYSFNDVYGNVYKEIMKDFKKSLPKK
jgi:hypothetical protein